MSEKLLVDLHVHLHPPLHFHKPFLSKKQNSSLLCLVPFTRLDLLGPVISFA